MMVEINLCEETKEMLDLVRHQMEYDSLDEVILYLGCRYLLNKDEKREQ